MHRWTVSSSDRRAGLLNLTLAAAVGLLAWFSWWILQNKPAPVAQQRTFDQVVVTWQCEQGHEYRGRGGFGPQPCRVCGADAFVIARYKCSEHGEMVAQLKHEIDADGTLVISGIRFADGHWSAYPQQIECPYCDRIMQPVRRDPFDAPIEEGRQSSRPPAPDAQ